MMGSGGGRGRMEGSGGRPDFMEGLDDMSSAEDNKFGACIWEYSADTGNTKCIAGMMKEEGPLGQKMGVACMHEIAGCYEEDGDLDEKCFQGEAMKNPRCMAALKALDDATESSSESSEDAPMFEAETMVYKKAKDCEKGKDNKAKPGKNKIVEFGCTMKTDDRGNERYERIGCNPESMDGAIMFSQHKDSNCEDEPLPKSVMSASTNDVVCEPTGKKGAIGVKIPANMLCVPEFFKTYTGTYDQVMEFCMMSKDNCKQCSGKMISNKKNGDQCKIKKAQCKKISKEMCNMFGGALGCKLDKRGKKCTGKMEIPKK